MGASHRRPRCPPGTPLPERLRAKITINSSNGCWEWQASLTTNGYGQIMVDKRKCYAHRIAYEVFVGEIPSDLEIDHLCCNKRCINPQHLETVTSRENTARHFNNWIDARSASHCKRGHEYTAANTLKRPNGGRACRTCSVVSNRRSVQRAEALPRLLPQ